MIAVTIVVILNVLGALSFPTGLSDTHCDQLLSDRFEKKTKKKKKMLSQQIAICRTLKNGVMCTNSPT